MKPISLAVSNAARFPSFAIMFSEGTCSIVGPNGSGKSTALGCIELALFSDGSRDLAPLLGPFSDRLDIELRFIHNDAEYRVRRGYRGGGRGVSTLDLDVEGSGAGPAWEPLTRESTKETQQHLESLLGLNRRTFGASAYLAQGDGAAFTDASPADRKVILSDVLDPRGYWPGVAKQASVERAQAERALDFDTAKTSELETITADHVFVEERLEDLRIEQAQAKRAVDDTDEALTVAQAALAGNAVAAEKWRAGKQAERTAQEWRDRCEQERREAMEQAELLEPAKVELAELEAEASKASFLWDMVELQQVSKHAYDLAMAELGKRSDVVNAQRAEVERVEHEIENAEATYSDSVRRKQTLERAEDDTHRCDRCNQLLGAEARAAAVLSLLAETEASHTRAAGLRAAAAQLRDELAKLIYARDSYEMPPVLQGDFSADLSRAQQAQRQYGVVAERIRQLEAHAGRYPDLMQQAVTAERELTKRAAETLQAAGEMRDEQALTLAVDQARNAQTRARAALDETNAQVTRCEEQLARVKQAEKDLAALKLGVKDAQANLDLLTLATRAFGRDGIPTLILENTLGALEANANSYLQMMPTTDGTILRVQLETQRALKTAEHLRETLDVLVADQDSARAYESFSGGERARVNIALRLALAILLADGRGAESRLLAIDEVDGLDQQGRGQLVEVIKTVADRFDSVWVVSHHEDLSDAFDQVLRVVKEDGVSRLVAA